MKRESLLVMALLIAGSLFFSLDSAWGQSAGYPGYPVGGAFVPVPGPEAPAPTPGVIPSEPIPHRPPPPGDTFVATTGIPEAGTAPGTTGVVSPEIGLPLPSVPPGALSYPAGAPGTGIPPLRPTYGPLVGDAVWDPVTRTYGTRSPVGPGTAPFGVSTRATRAGTVPGAGSSGFRRDTVPGTADPDPGGETGATAGSTAPFDATGAGGPVPGGAPETR